MYIFHAAYFKLRHNIVIKNNISTYIIINPTLIQNVLLKKQIHIPTLFQIYWKAFW